MGSPVIFTHGLLDTRGQYFTAFSFAPTCRKLYDYTQHGLYICAWAALCCRNAKVHCDWHDFAQKYPNKACLHPLMLKTTLLLIAASCGTTGITRKDILMNKSRLNHVKYSSLRTNANISCFSHSTGLWCTWCTASWLCGPAWAGPTSPSSCLTASSSTASPWSKSAGFASPQASAPSPHSSVSPLCPGRWGRVGNCPFFGWNGRKGLSVVLCFSWRRLISWRGTLSCVIFSSTEVAGSL